MRNETRVIVSTNAFGMGIDKPDVRSVIHLDLPDDLESYYQEAGRGGHDEKSSFAVILYNQSDILDLERRMMMNFPEVDDIKKVYQALCNYLQIAVNSGAGLTFEFDLLHFSEQYKFDPVRTYNCLKVLELEDHLTLTDSVYLPSRIFILVKNYDLYKFQVENAEYDHLIKTMLRSYAGLFDNYVRFSETELARRAGIEFPQLKRELETMHQREIISYLPSTEVPRLTFNEARVDVSKLRISSESLDDRKQRFLLRASAFKRYVTDKHHCRSMILLSYFGEENLHRCGTCDYCRERNKLALNDLEMEEISNEIKQLLIIKPELPLSLSEKIKNYPAEKVSAVLRWLLDTGELKSDDSGMIYVKAD